MGRAGPSGPPRCRSLPLLAIAIFLAAGALLAMSPGAQGAAGWPAPVPSIRLTPVNATVLLHQRDAIVNFSGQATVDRLPVERIVLNLEASVDTGWSVGMQPALLIFTSTRPQPFCVTVTVPAGTPGDTTGILSVTGRCTWSGIVFSGGVRSQIWVTPRTGIGLETKTPIIQVPRGGNATIELSVRNDGNMNDSFAVSVPDREALERRGWTIRSPDPEIPNLRPGETRQLRLAVSIGLGLSMPDRPEHFDVTVESLNASRREGAGSRTLELLVFPGRLDSAAAFRQAGLSGELWPQAPPASWAPWGLVLAPWLAELAIRRRRRRAFR